MVNGKDQYFVAVKVFLEDASGNVLLTKDRFGDWDIPGGRLRPNDFNVPLEDVVARKMKEELGEDVDYSLEEPVVFMRHERNEQLQSGGSEVRRIFAIGYRASYLGGDISLGESHELFEWVNLEKADMSQYLSGGWLLGMNEYLEKVHGRK